MLWLQYTSRDAMWIFIISHMLVIGLYTTVYNYMHANNSSCNVDEEFLALLYKRGLFSYEENTTAFDRQKLKFGFFDVFNVSTTVNDQNCGFELKYYMRKQNGSRWLIYQKFPHNQWEFAQIKHTEFHVWHSIFIIHNLKKKVRFHCFRPQIAQPTPPS